MLDRGSLRWQRLGGLHQFGNTRGPDAGRVCPQAAPPLPPELAQ